MATYATAGMYPPIVDSYIPAFLYSDIVDQKRDTIPEKNITLYFQISSFTKAEDIKEIHVSFSRQDNYQSIFREDPYIRGIWISPVWAAADNLVTEGEFAGYYKIEIPSEVLTSKQIKISTYYKIQIRFSKINISDRSSAEKVSNYLLDTENMNYFSEWSTVILGRFISNPNVSLKINNDDNELTTQIRDISSSMASFHGKFSTIEQDENLQSYQFILNNSDNSITYYESEIIQTNKNNGINDIVFTLPYSLESNVVYNVLLKYRTRNLYSNEITYKIRNILNKRSWSETDVTIDSITNSAIGKLNISLGNLLENDIIIIRRASNLDNYTRWDIIYKKTFTSATADFSYDDYTIEAGTMYKYEIILMRNNLTYSTTIENVLSIFNDAYLTGEGTQLSVKFNPNVSNYRRNVSDSVITTIGSKFPYIDRNAYVDYRSFSLSGTIAYEMDNEHRFTTRSAIYGDEIEIYGSYFVNHYIRANNDILTQRKFRELVLDYLYSDIPKVFRSAAEGNILVRLTDVTLTPNQSLGRMIYDFSCTATEIGEANIENMKLYQVQDFGEA